MNDRTKNPPPGWPVDRPAGQADAAGAIRRAVYIRPVVGDKGEKMFVTHSAEGVPISLDLTFEAAVTRATLSNLSAQALN